MKRWLASMLLAATVLLGGADLAGASEELSIRGTIPVPVWNAFRDRFVDPSGRVIDDANGGISHSEGQGYGLILALAGDDRASFERIWSFTQTALMLRDDGLAAWSWRPELPHVPDVNNASDGDLLIAYALAKAGEAWEEPRYMAEATRIAAALGGVAIAEHENRQWLLPGVNGFAAADRPDGPVVNLSYWVFEALPTMARLVPEVDWNALRQSGLWLVETARFGQAGLPTDWISVHGAAAPAAGFDPDFGYNAIRVPLYLLRAGVKDARWLAPFSASWQKGAVSGLPLVNVMTDKTVATLTEPGYRMMAAVLDCVEKGSAVPSDLRMFTPTRYYPSTLYLLSLSYLAERHPECL